MLDALLAELDDRFSIPLRKKEIENYRQKRFTTKYHLYTATLPLPTASL